MLCCRVPRNLIWSQLESTKYGNACYRQKSSKLFSRPQAKRTQKPHRSPTKEKFEFKNSSQAFPAKLKVSGIHQRFELERRRTEYLVERAKTQLRSCAELSFDDKVVDSIMSTSPYHIASLLDKVRHVKICFFTAIVACARTCTSRYQMWNASCFDRSISFCSLKCTSLHLMLVFSFC